MVFSFLFSFDDEMYRLQAKYASAIFSHDSASFLHDLTDRDPLQYSVTVPAGNNSQNIQAIGVKVSAKRAGEHLLSARFA